MFILIINFLSYLFLLHAGAKRVGVWSSWIHWKRADRLEKVECNRYLQSSEMGQYF